MRASTSMLPEAPLPDTWVTRAPLFSITRRSALRSMEPASPSPSPLTKIAPKLELGSLPEMRTVPAASITTAPALPPSSDEEPGEDPFNREYAEKQTILALEYLKDQLAKEKPDPKLLDALGGWTRDDLAKFTRRWEAMFREARQPGTEGQQARARLTEALKSLGLRRGRAEIRGGTRKDKMGGLRGPRDIAPPPDWEEQVRAYRRGIGKGK